LCLYKDNEKPAEVSQGGLIGAPLLGKPSYLIFASLYITCLRALGSNFLISIFSGMVFLFFVVV
jgi:hypothetical protein